MSAWRIVGASVPTPRGPRVQTVAIRGDRIESAEGAGAAAAGDRDFDGSGLSVLPGFIDIQINGGHGLDLTADPSSMWELGEILPRYGVASFLPTLISAQTGTIDHALAALRSRPAAYRGAEPLGLHLEGPMLNPQYRGAHPAEHLRQPSLALIQGWTRDNGVLLVTLAPELSGAAAVVRRLASNGVVVAAGHTAATADQAEAAVAAGVAAVTHLFNAMAPLHHRAPNLAGVALSSSTIVAGLVADGVHVEPRVVALAWRAKGRDSLVLVTDAVAAMGMPAGTYTLASGTIKADGAAVRLPDGTIAGSTLSMIDAVRNLMRFTGCSLADAACCASATPAALLNLPDRGQLRAGAVADLTLVDESHRIAATVCRGALAYVATSERGRLPAAAGRPGSDQGDAFSGPARGTARAVEL